MVTVLAQKKKVSALMGQDNIKIFPKITMPQLTTNKSQTYLFDSIPALARLISVKFRLYLVRLRCYRIAKHPCKMQATVIAVAFSLVGLIVGQGRMMDGGIPCVFPFEFQGESHTDCVEFSGIEWCEDEEGNFGVCLPDETVAAALSAVANGAAIQPEEEEEVVSLAVPDASDPNSCVVVNEIVHKPVLPEEDWIEMFNLCDEMIDLSNYWIRDSSPDHLFKLGAAGCVHQIQPRGYLVLERNQPCSFTWGLATDDEVHLLDPTLQELQFVIWTKTDAREGKSWARLPSGRGSFQTTTPTPGEFNGISIVVPDRAVATLEEVTVVINEVVNSPVAPDLDWIELYNYGTAAVNLTGIRLTDEATNPGDGFYFGQPGCQANTVIEAGEYFVLTRDKECSFEFGLGNNDQAILWFDLETMIDSTAFGPKYNGTVVPSDVSWGRLPNGREGSFTTLVPTKASANQDAITGDALIFKIAADVEASLS
eukprot:TRINITY_DN1287_c0_g1_i11.p1 TRINITY_DN1287_c0_g1~~TRINITY_DN1287_c0_g1_i11.p1  ORF type:complete len:482 (-),score=97.34 TRINITY_DN1287_c0_g1_i11:509-1954(-)